MKEITKIPRHIAFIMDGNGRWAAKRGLSRKFGHKKGVQSLIKILRHTFDSGIYCASIYAFSTENCNRPQDEIDALCDLFRENFAKTFNEFIERGVRIYVMGDPSFFPQDIQDIIVQMCERSKQGTTGVLNIGLNYGSRHEIIRAVNMAIDNGKKITEKEFNDLLYTHDLPDPDLIVRTSGEMRLSNFMLYQAAYSEFYFTKTLWPDFTPRELDKILLNFSKRHRRFGKV